MRDKVQGYWDRMWRAMKRHAETLRAYTADEEPREPTKPVERAPRVPPPPGFKKWKPPLDSVAR